jgi:hypothetical protein
MRRPALKSGRGTWAEIAIAAGVTVVVVLAVRWLLYPALLVEAAIGALTYSLGLLLLIGRRSARTT